MVETAIMFPIFLAIIFIFLFMGIAYNARASLKAAVETVRLAYTRGQTELVGSDIIQDVQTWQSSGSPTAPPNPLMTLLAHDGPATTAFGAGGYYNQMANDWFGVNFIDLPSYYIYAHIYAVQSMKQSVGPSLKFPCDPTTQAGCLECRNLHPEEITAPGTCNSLTPTGCTALVPPATAANNPGFNLAYVGLECRYRPSSIFVDPIINLLRLVVGNAATAPIIITRRAYFP